MPTNEERHKAACMVRNASNQSPRMWQQIRGMLGMPKDCGIPQIREHLASLIEPETERTCHIEPDPDDPDIEKPWYRCRSCGYTRSVDDWSLWSYCPNCGARAVSYGMD